MVATAMTQQNVILTGMLRSGTTLVCHLLNKLPDTVALFEPMTVSELPGLKSHAAICDRIDEFLQQTRETLQTRKLALSKHVGGVIPDSHIADVAEGLRRDVSSRGEIRFEKELGRDFLLVVKHPAAFTALLDSLVGRFRCYAIIRNPLSVLGSWNSVAMKVESGHLPIAERLDESLREALSRINDKFDRQFHLLSWFYGKYRAALSDESIIRYEEIVASRGKALSAITARANELNEPLENKNKNPHYDRKLMRFLGRRLLDGEGAWREFYSAESVERLLAD